MRTVVYVDGFNLYYGDNALQRSQLPDPIPGTNIRKPARW